ncbi:sigma-54 dependent transcriptional regulator [Vibrio hannami]|uniref:sigma-54-dependent transcriptional regulator n=1 Tax=Vibrio hannami TaxID=2717094 RepID=UPI00240F0937|nr:sigma-54 dependent transcriptional regulator [Vibrio hannami]MDG3088151.1 sigma-54 dependent transcriptional regulator [Vibrio hannami]
MEPRYQGLSVLIVDSDVTIGQDLSKLFTTISFQVTAITSLYDIVTGDFEHYDIILLDAKSIGNERESWEKFKLSNDKRSGCLIFLADQNSIETVRSDLAIGSCDLLLKPFTHEQIAQSVKYCADRIISKRTTIAHQRDLKRYHVDQIVGDSDTTKRLLQTIKQLAPSRATVLIAGESGTGKELVARGLHHQSNRSGPFIPVNCSTSEKQLNQEFFGKQNNVFQLAQGGTLFLDQVSELPMSIQGALLRIIDEGCSRSGEESRCSPLDIRIIAATNKDLTSEVSNLRFRGDLYYRLSVLFIDLLPLRERKADLAPLVEYFTEQLLKEQANNASLLWEEEDIEAMYHYHWPGNVRELRNIIERCILIGKPPAQYWRDLGFDVSKSKEQYYAYVAKNSDDTSTFPEFSQKPTQGYPLEWTLKEVEKAHILQVVDLHDGNKSAAAKQLGVARKTLERKFKMWDEE